MYILLAIAIQSQSNRLCVWWRMNIPVHEWWHCWIYWHNNDNCLFLLITENFRSDVKSRRGDLPRASSGKVLWRSRNFRSSSMLFKVFLTIVRLAMECLLQTIDWDLETEFVEDNLRDRHNLVGSGLWFNKITASLLYSKALFAETRLFEVIPEDFKWDHQDIWNKRSLIRSYKPQSRLYPANGLPCISVKSLPFYCCESSTSYWLGMPDRCHILWWVLFFVLCEYFQLTWAIRVFVNLYIQRLPSHSLFCLIFSFLRLRSFHDCEMADLMNG
jgi:hypothetical protein